MSGMKFPNHIASDDPIRERTEQFHARRNGNAKPDAELMAFIRRGICLEALDGSGWTALHYMAGAGRAEIVKTLLAIGTDIEASDYDGWTPLRVAVANKQIRAVEALLAAGANIDARENHGFTALSMAAPRCDSSMIDTLIASGADIESRSYDGKTPLMRAFEQDNTDTIQALLERGANIYARGNDNKAVLDGNVDSLLRNIIKQRQDDYEIFVTSHDAPATAHKVCQLLSVTPLTDPAAHVDYIGNLRRIFSHAHWESKGQAESILKEMRMQDIISDETVESILVSTFPPERTRSTPRSQTRSVGVAI